MRASASATEPNGIAGRGSSRERPGAPGGRPDRRADAARPTRATNRAAALVAERRRRRTTLAGRPARRALRRPARPRRGRRGRAASRPRVCAAAADSRRRSSPWASPASTSSLVSASPSMPEMRIASRSAGRSSQPQRRGRPVTEPNSLPRLRSRSPVSSLQLGRERARRRRASRSPWRCPSTVSICGRADAQRRRRRRRPSSTTTSRTDTCRGRRRAARPARPRTARCRRATIASCTSREASPT